MATNEERLACLGYDLVCVINELTGYQHQAVEHLRIDYEAMQNGFIGIAALDSAEFYAKVMRRELGLTE